MFVFVPESRICWRFMSAYCRLRMVSEAQGLEELSRGGYLKILLSSDSSVAFLNTTGLPSGSRTLAAGSNSASTRKVT